MARDAYLALDRGSDDKHELWDGSAYAMTGASLAHNRLVRNLLVSLSGVLAGKGCEVLPSDLRVRIPGQARYLYPDLTIVCGPPQLEDDQADTLLNPRVVIEVLSGSTEAFDRGQKFEAYRAIPTLSEYVLVAQDAARVDHFARDAERGVWALRPYAGSDTLRFPSLAVGVPLAQIYAGVLLAESSEG
jgi:Uma2 family endonuclease